MFVERSLAGVMDAAMCIMMNRIQWKLRHTACTTEELETYFARCESITREDFYSIPHPADFREMKGQLEWPSPNSSGFSENDTARALWFVGPGGPAAPTAIVLHALMSASDIGYRRLAKWFHCRGWNMVFPHLPFHYSRVPRGHINGSLAISGNLIRNAETLRQAVVEQRQIIAHLRTHGCTDFGLIGTSYGGWVGSLLSFVEPEFRFISLIQPIIDTEHAIWDAPVAASIRRILAERGIRRGDALRHAHLSSPLFGQPHAPKDRVMIVAGSYDTVSPPAGLQELANAWSGSQYVEVQQGHFGHAALREAKRRIEPILTRS